MGILEKLVSTFTGAPTDADQPPGAAPASSSIDRIQHALETGDTSQLNAWEYMKIAGDRDNSDREYKCVFGIIDRQARERARGRGQSPYAGAKPIDFGDKRKL